MFFSFGLAQDYASQYSLLIEKIYCNCSARFFEKISFDEVNVDQFLFVKWFQHFVSKSTEIIQMQFKNCIKV